MSSHEELDQQYLDAVALDDERDLRMANRLPHTDKIWRRPVYERLLRRKHFMPLEPPTQQEYEDALDVLIEDERDELDEEAVRIIREVDGLPGP